MKDEIDIDHSPNIQSLRSGKKKHSIKVETTGGAKKFEYSSTEIKY